MVMVCGGKMGLVDRRRRRLGIDGTHRGMLHPEVRLPEIRHTRDGREIEVVGAWSFGDAYVRLLSRV